MAPRKKTRRDIQLRVRISPIELKSLEAVSIITGKTVSEIVRDGLKAEAEKLTYSPADNQAEGK